MNKVILFIYVSSPFLFSFLNNDNQTLLTGGNTPKTWELSNFIFDGYDYTDSAACVKGMQLTFSEGSMFSIANPCDSEVLTGQYQLFSDMIIVEKDTFELLELTENKLKYGRTKKVMSKFNGEDFVELDHSYYFLFYPKLN